MQTGRVGVALALVASAIVLWPTAPDARRATGEAFIPAQAATQPWPIKEFEVINVEPLNIADIDNPRLEHLLIRASRLLPHDIEAAGLRFVHPSGDLAAAMADMEIMLRRGAAQFERWRFPSPQLEPVVTRNGRPVFRVYLVASLGDSAGRYHAPTCIAPPSPETIVKLSASQILGGGASGGAVRLTDSGLLVLNHELFHAVQFATPFYENACGNVVGGWITEGTADAVGYDIARSLGTGLPSVPREALWGRRNYSERLAVPAGGGYRTSSFWRYLAELYSAGPPGPAPGPVDYGYLVDFLSTRPSGRDCVTVNDPCDTEIARLDGWLKRTYGGQGLREHLPKFLAAYVHYGEARGTGGTPESRNEAWRGASFDGGCKTVELSPASMELGDDSFGGLVHEDTVSVKDTAARCWSVEPVDFDSDLIGVEIEVRSAGDRVLSQLVAVRASRQGDEVSLQEAIVDINQTTGEPRVRFMFPFRNGEKTPFLLVNVAHDAQTTTAIEDIPIKFEALVEYASMEPSTVDLASLAEAIDAPFEIELKTYQAVLMQDRHEKSGDTFMGLGPAAGVERPCFLQLSGSAPQRVGAFFPDALVLQMRTSGPITAGETYQIRSAREKRNPSDLTPNVAAASVLITEGDGEQYAYDVEHGQLKIDSVAGNLLRGRLTGEGVYFEWSTQTMQYEVRRVQQLAVKFSIRVQAPLGPYRDRPYPCLQPRVSGTGTGGAPPAPGSPGPPAAPPGAGGPPPPSGSPGPPAAPPGAGVPGTTGGGGDAASPARPSEAATAALGPGRTRWVSVRAQGRPDLSFAGSDLDGTAGVALVCFGAHSPALLVLHKGPSGQTAEMALHVTAVGVAEGATGTFRLEQVQYVVPGAALSGRGPATLEITRHTTSVDPAARRMVGRIVGVSVLDPQTRGAIPIEADFDVNTACAPFGR